MPPKKPTAKKPATKKSATKKSATQKTATKKSATKKAARPGALRFSEEDLENIREAVAEKLGAAMGKKVFKALSSGFTPPPPDR